MLGAGIKPVRLATPVIPFEKPEAELWMHTFHGEKTGFLAKCASQPLFLKQKVITGRRVYHSPKNYITGRKKHHSLADLPHRSQEVPHRSTWSIP